MFDRSRFTFLSAFASSFYSDSIVPLSAGASARTATRAPLCCTAASASRTASWCTAAARSKATATEAYAATGSMSLSVVISVAGAAWRKRRSVVETPLCGASAGFGSIGCTSSNSSCGMLWHAARSRACQRGALPLIQTPYHVVFPCTPIVESQYFPLHFPSKFQSVQKTVRRSGHELAANIRLNPTNLC